MTAQNNLLSLDGRGYRSLAACCLAKVGEGERRLAPRERVALAPLSLPLPSAAGPSLSRKGRGE